MKLLFPTDHKIVFDLPDATISYYPIFFSKDEADAILKELTDTTPWRQDSITVFGKNKILQVSPQVR